MLYSKTMKRGEPCLYPDCGYPAIGAGYCSAHYQQRRKGQVLRPREVLHTHCTFPGCDRRHEAHGFCPGHYLQQKQGRPLRPLLDWASSPYTQEGDTFLFTLYVQGGDVGEVSEVIAGHVRVSTCDFDMVHGQRLNLNSGGYARLSDGRLLHRVLLGLDKNDKRIADHIDGVRLNCVRENLRIITRQENSHNKPANRNSTTGLRGVYIDKRGRYYARVKLHGAPHDLRYFDTAAEADAAISKLRATLMSHTNEERRATQNPVAYPLK